MCGIAGVISGSGGARPETLRAMAESLHHRGPDGRGFLQWAPGRSLRATREPGGDPGGVVGFAHNRLTILDLTHAADQPMVDRAGELALVYNGELYNYVELREGLEGRGHAFASTGDTEVVLAAYREWGRDCVRRFVGMWAFAVLDTRSRSVLLSRDRFGIKPLYLAPLAGGLAFASEIKGLLAAGVAREPDERVVRRYLLTGRVDESDATFFAAVRRLPPAHDMLVPVDAVTSSHPARRYWEPPPPPPVGAREPVGAAAGFARHLRDAVRLHTRSDVPVGSCLSGGLDSSAVVCVADELRRDGTLAASYAHHGLGYVPEDPELSEVGYMEAVARHAGVELTQVRPPAEEVMARLPEIVRQADEPFGTASVAAQWFVFRAARERGLKVMLDGQGADEYLAGYPGYLATLARDHLRRRRAAAYVRLAIAMRRRTGAWPLPWREALATARARVPQETSEAPPPPTPLLGAELRAGMQVGDWTVEPSDDLETTLRRHLTRIGLPALLRFEDRNSMAHSIEARVPFLDHRLVEYALALPTSAKICVAETKSILRRALADTLPREVLQRRDKIGFRAEPDVTWEYARRNRDDLVSPRGGYEARWLSSGELARLIDHGGGPEEEFALWRAINLKLWLRHVVDAELPAGSVATGR